MKVINNMPNQFGNGIADGMQNGAEKLEKSSIIQSINKLEKSSREDMTIINNASTHSLQSSNIRDLVNMNIHLYEMTVRYEICAKVASKSIQGLESLLRTQ